MISSQSIRIALLCGLIFATAAAFRQDGSGTSGPGSAYAQDSGTGKARPARQAPSGSSEDEDRPMGQTSISVDVDLVTLQVLVTDPKGSVITGLKPENFTIYEDNVKQEIVNFAPIDANLTVVMLVEFSNNIRYFINDIWNAMYYFANSLRKDDWVAVIGYDMHSTILCDFTQNRQELQNALRRFTIPAYYESNLSDALYDALDRVEEIEGKVAILLISTGLDTFSRRTYQEALEKCKQSNASVYAVSVGQHFRLRAEAAGLISNEANIDLLMADNRLKSFAEYSGGAAYFPRFETELPAIFSNISELLRSQYSIGYVSSNTKKDGKYRKIRVEVEAGLKDKKGKPVKLKVSTRKGYTAKSS